MSLDTTATSSSIEGTSLIGGSAVRGTDGTITATDPRTGAALTPVFGLIGATELDLAADLATEAFDSYRSTLPEQRAAFLETIADNIARIGEALADRIVAETGLPRARAVQETGRTTGQLRLFAAVLREGNYHDARIDSALPDRTPLPRADIRLRKIPLGPVAVFGASNFPLAFSVAGGDTASALAAGCPVIVKAHGAHPGTAELVGRAIVAAVAANGLHPGVFALVFGRGNEIGTRLVQHPAITAVGFTGSRRGGLALVDAAARRPVPIPVYAEMSSINPVFVLPSALDDAARVLGEAWAGSLTLGAGQFCTNPGLLFLADGPGADAFLAGASEAVAAASAAPMLTAGIADAFADGAAAFAGHDSVTTIATGTNDASIAVAGLPQVYEVNAATFRADPVLQEEVFGPAGLVIRVADASAMTDLLESMEGQLTVTVHSDGTDDGVRELVATAEQRAGRILFNGWPTGVEVGHAMVHGGPFPATSNARTTSVGTLAMDRFLRPVSYQSFPAALLPPELADDNPLGLWRQHDGVLSRS
ncbi:aldehyde dehydrogenase (NADP(+)) [Rathayibacter sp. VKM Ac-2835]|uniref:aldehyde dehydrogenase (NADP(+)) n=1 Tax=Rathayibacter sp. VKM Ac-2835 TaxID=2739043 RepID=UPI00156331E7|nr:aldehyde dehydrogenase (NADP(+)) [Rathayibacter sp. VKM Ac-2835]NRG43027.1 aldehyde dehydrogenase (NADP(+)) [Rathayibacter sp. VKM Ac-2835]